MGMSGRSFQLPLPVYANQDSLVKWNPGMNTNKPRTKRPIKALVPSVCHRVRPTIKSTKPVHDGMGSDELGCRERDGGMIEWALGLRNGTCNEKSYGIENCFPRNFFVNTTNCVSRPTSDHFKIGLTQGDYVDFIGGSMG